MKKKLQNLYLLLIVIFLYAPIMTLMVLSFNSSRTRAKWGGFIPENGMYPFSRMKRS